MQESAVFFARSSLILSYPSISSFPHCFCLFFDLCISSCDVALILSALCSCCSMHSMGLLEDISFSLSSSSHTTSGRTQNSKITAKKLIKISQNPAPHPSLSSNEQKSEGKHGSEERRRNTTQRKKVQREANTHQQKKAAD